MKYVVIFANQAEDDPDFNPAKSVDYGFLVEASDAEEAFDKWKMPEDYSENWLLVAIIPETELDLYKLENDGIPFIMR
jgi:hypothetical protein